MSGYRIEAATAALRGEMTGGWAWYLYGVMERVPEEDAHEIAPGLDERAPAQLLARGGLSAIASKVSLSEFAAEPLKAQLRDAAWLEPMVRGHQRIVAAAQRRRTVLPAKFGCVYPTTAALLEAIDAREESLLAQLARLHGCEEWGIRLYASRSLVEQSITAEDGTVGRLRRDLASAAPGRAYFLRRKLADALASATGQTIADMAQEAHERFLTRCLAGEVGRPTDGHPTTGGEVEILHVAYLVRVKSAEAFLSAVEEFTAHRRGLRCEHSGPWAPYSFADFGAETRDEQ